MVTIRRGSETVEAEVPVADDVALVEGMTVAETPAIAAPVATIPYAFARDRGYAVLGEADEGLRLAMREDADPLVLLRSRGYVRPGTEFFGERP